MATGGAKELDQIVKSTIDAVEKSKGQIFDIYEASRREMEHLQRDVERLKQQTAEIIFKVDDIEKRERRSRLRLMEVSRDFQRYSEAHIKEAYEEANRLQVDLAVLRSQEQSIRRMRDEAETRLKTLKETVDKAERLVSQVGVVLDFLSTEMGGVVNQLETLQQKQFFGAKIIQAQEEERRRVAREIHDGPAQSMANIVFRAEVCEHFLDSDVERARNELQELRALVRSSLAEVRKIIFDLRPMTLDDLGLVATVKRALEGVEKRSGLVCELRVSGSAQRLDSHVEVGVFRIVQEAVTNVEKHAQARTVAVQLDYSFHFISLVIEDDGQGIADLENIGEESFGLMGMKERVSLLGGEIAIESKVGEGTRIKVKIPLRTKNAL